EVADVRRQLEALDIRPPGPARPVATLSGGNQQKVVLARWLLGAAGLRLLILDEPTRGVDVGARAELYQVIRELAGRGIGVLLVSSEVPEVLGLRSEEHTSELQSRENLVCRLLLEKKKKAN